MTKDELLAAIDAGWNQFQGFLATLTYEQVTIPTDPADWTAKDHVAHLAAWEDTLNALLDKRLRRESLGVSAEDWDNQDWDRVNEVVRQRYKDISLGDLREWFFGLHEKLIARLKAMSDEDLRRPYKDFQPDADWERPVIHWFQIDTYQHYAEHTPWIAEIAAGESGILNKSTLLAAIASAWGDLNAYLDTLTPRQLNRLTDASGWTVKDHAIHLAMWENGIYGLLSKQSRSEYMGLDAATWEQHDLDQMNAVIRDNNAALTWDEVQQKRHEIHDRLVRKIESMTDEDLQRPYGDYDLSEPGGKAVINWITGNTFAHYAEHRPWMQAIADSAPETYTKAETLANLRRGWDDLNAYLDTLTEAQATTPTDAAGWTVKDHLIHLAVWEGSLNAFFQKLPRWDALGVDQATYESGDIDHVNELIRQQNQTPTWAQARQSFRQRHDELVGRIEALSEDDLQMPYNYYQPTSKATDTAAHRVSIATYHHYAEHIPWMQAIAAQA
jgi:uncharacterized protein (TIGR03083 family)